jgi:hypothetical protein
MECMTKNDKRVILYARESIPGDNASYENKFSPLIKAIAAAKKDWTEAIVVAEPWVLGDSKEELIESLSRIAGSQIYLVILHRQRLSKHDQN